VRDAAGGAVVSWEPAPASPDLLGYHVYRGSGVGERFARLNASPLATASFHDSAAPVDPALYQVRALYREVTGSGSFINSAQAAFAALADLPEVAVVPATIAAREGGEPAVFSVTRSGDLGSPLDAQLEFHGSATVKGDFAGASAQLSFAAGESEVWVEMVATPDSEPEGAEELVVSVSAADPVHYRAGPTEVCITIYDDGYGVFAEQWFSHQAPDPAVGGESADPDGDGLPNLIEFATGSSPVEYSAGPLEARANVEIDSVAHRAYYAPCSPLLVGVALRLETSSDLADWVVPEGLRDRHYAIGPGAFEIEFLVPESALGARVFVRLVAERL
jgi:hypothetical protein